MDAPGEKCNPFPGLRPFEAEEDHLFFGREEEIDALLGRLRTARFLAVVGTSGSGKSSLVRCGLVPSLHSGYMVRAGSSWRVAILRPGGDPIGHLAAALGAPGILGPEGGELDEMAGMLLEATLHGSGVALVDSVRHARLPSRDNVLVVVDQFEELFRFKDSREVADARGEALAFVKLLLEAARREEARIYVVLTMRSDFIGQCMEFPGLPEAINAGQFLVPRMSRDDLRRAITGPVAVGGGELAPRLVLRLLNDVGDDPDQLPILQHALMRTWDCWQARANGGPIDLEHYSAIGTLSEAMSLHAEEAYGELAGERRQGIARRLFQALTDKVSDPRGVRRPSRLDEICAVAEAEPAEVIEVIERFRLPGRCFLMPPAGVRLAADTILDLSHESLMRVWGRLGSWADDEAQAGHRYRRLSRAAARHEAGEGGLWDDPELQIGQIWRRETQPSAAWARRYDPDFDRAIGFLDASQQLHDREIAEREAARRSQLRRARALATVFFLLTVLAVAFGFFAWKAQREAETQRRLAEARTAEAEAARAVAVGEKAKAQQARDDAEVAQREEQHQRRQAEEKEALAQAAKQDADRQRARAEAKEWETEQARLEAEAARREEAEQRRIAERNEQKAVENEHRAWEKERVARRLQTLSQARSLAVEAPLLAEETPELAALLAVQSYRLVRRQGVGEDIPGFDPESPEVYQALRRTCERLPGGPPVRRDLPSAVRAIAVTGNTLAAGTEGSGVLTFDLTAAAGATKPFGRAPGRTRSVAFSSDGRWLVVGGFDGTIRWWDRERPDASPETVAAHDRSVNALAFLPGSARVVSGGTDGEVRSWDLERPASGGERLFGGEHRITALAFGDGLLAVGADGAGVALLGLEPTAEIPRVACGGRSVRSVAVDPAGRRLACGDAGGAIEVWTAGDRPALIRALTPGHRSAVNALSFNPAGDQLASGSADGSVRLWDLERPDAPPVELDDHAGWVWAVAFDDLGGRLFSGSEDRSVRVWPTRAELLAQEICRRVPRDLTEEEWDAHLAGVPREPTCSGRAADRSAAPDGRAFGRSR